MEDDGITMHTQKGDFGYIGAYKKKRVLLAAILGVMIACVVAGTIYMYGDTKHVIIVCAILLVLPFAKQLIGLITVLPYSSIETETYNMLKELIDADHPGLMFDLVLSRYEGMMFYPIVLVRNEKVYAYVRDKDFEEKKKTYQSWIEQTLKDSYDCPVKILDSMDALIKKANQPVSGDETVRKKDRYIKERLMASCV